VLSRGKRWLQGRLRLRFWVGSTTSRIDESVTGGTPRVTLSRYSLTHTHRHFEHLGNLQRPSVRPPGRALNPCTSHWLPASSKFRMIRRASLLVLGGECWGAALPGVRRRSGVSLPGTSHARHGRRQRSAKHARRQSGFSRQFLRTRSGASRPRWARFDCPPPARTEQRGSRLEGCERSPLGRSSFFERRSPDNSSIRTTTGPAVSLGKVGETGKVSLRRMHIPSSGFVDTRTPRQSRSRLAASGASAEHRRCLEVAVAPLDRLG